MYNVGQGKGLTFWAPNINIFRDPRWGRGQETPGEDPQLAAKYGVSYVSKQDMADTFQPPFQSCVEQGRASSIMCAYNRVNGIPSCAHYDFLTETARGLWHFDGYIVSDCNAVPIIYEQQGYAKTPEDAVAAVLNAGMDVECGSYTQRYSKSALDHKKVTEKEIDRALNNLFSVRMRLGLFDGDPRKKEYFGKFGPEKVCSEEHQNLTLEAAKNSIVLLKNANNLLPLSKAKTKSLALIGPNADSSQVLLGNYEGFPCKNMTILEAFKSYVDNIKYHSGCNAVECSSAEVEKVVEIVKEVDFVVLVMGLDQTQEREKLDRVDLVLPGKQQSLIASVAEAAKRPVVVVLLCGGPVDISRTRDDDKVGSILWGGYPGEAGGVAIAQIIFGEHNPGGRLPMTWYPQEFTKVPMTDMRMRPDKSSGYPGRTYRFYQGKKVFEFGYGLSYSNYSYEFASVTRDKLSLNQESNTNQFLQSSNTTDSILISELGTETCEIMKFSAVVRVRNNDEMAGRHPVLLFARTDKQNDENPVKQLIGFETVSLNGGQVRDIMFTVSPCEHLSAANKDGLIAMDRGVYFLVVGDVDCQINITA
ncbi:putative beta-D-xylosidase 7 [Bienertia sinuspersici]